MLGGIFVAMVAAAATPETATISSGTIFVSTTGEPVHAHGAGIILPDTHPAGAGGKYYMVGATQKTQPGWLSEGINMYSSFDLQHWKFEHEIFHNTSITTPLPEGEIPYYRIERPKVIYNKMTKKYVMYFHLDSAGFKMGMVGVCTCDTVAGDYEFVDGFQPDGQRSLDMGLFQDLDGTAYLVRSVDNKYAGFSRLSPDYLRPTGIFSAGPKCEGQAVWRTGDDYYLLGSHLTGWAANPAILSHTKGPLTNSSKWTVLGNPSGSSTTFDSQSTYVLPYKHPSGKTLMIYLGDRWNGRGENGGVGNASYVWLPLIPSTESPALFKMPPLDGMGNGEWKVADY